MTGIYYKILKLFTFILRIIKIIYIIISFPFYLLRKLYRFLWIIYVLNIKRPFVSLFRLWLYNHPFHYNSYREIKEALSFLRYLWDAELRLLTGTPWSLIPLWDITRTKFLTDLMTFKNNNKILSFIHKRFDFQTLLELFFTNSKLIYYYYPHSEQRSIRYRWRRRHNRLYRLVMLRKALNNFRSIFIPNLIWYLWNSDIYKILQKGTYIHLFYVFCLDFPFSYFFFSIGYIITKVYFFCFGLKEKLLNFHYYLHWKYSLWGDLSTFFVYRRIVTFYSIKKRLGFTFFVFRTILSFIWKYIHILLWGYFFFFRLNLSIEGTCLIFNIMEIWRDLAREYYHQWAVFGKYMSCRIEDVYQYLLIYHHTGFLFESYNKEKDMMYPVFYTIGVSYTFLKRIPFFKKWEVVAKFSLKNYIYENFPFMFVRHFFSNYKWYNWTIGNYKYQMHQDDIAIFADFVVKQFFPVIFFEFMIDGYIEELKILDDPLETVVEEKVMDAITEAQAEEVVDDIEDDLINNCIKENVGELQNYVVINKDSKRLVRRRKTMEKLQRLSDRCGKKYFRKYRKGLLS